MSQGTHDLPVPLPLTHPIYHILLVLATGERHGYGLRRAIVASTEGRMRVGSGSLYRSLDVLLAAGLIGETWGMIDDTPTPRRLFRLTDLGERIARAETERLAHLVTMARHVPRLWDDPAPGALLVPPTSYPPASHPAHSAYGREES
jgi:DNA-binding PadR family transcriptional regulator